MPKRTGPEGFREVSASGSHYQIGAAIGKQCRDQALRLQKIFKESLAHGAGMSMGKALAHAKKTMPQTRQYAPEYIEELEGYAEGAGMSIELVYAMMHEIPGLGRGRGCTDIAVNSEWTKDDCVYAVHNDDISPLYAPVLTISRIRPSDEPGFIALCYGGIQPTSGMNAAGISITGNALEHNDERLGIPQEVAVRKVLGQTGLHQALVASVPAARGNSYNNIVCDSSGEIYSVEGSATTFDALYASDGWLVHTNHYLSPRMWAFEKNMHTRFSSIMRYNRAVKLLKKELGEVDLSTFKRVMSDHVGHPDSICRHVISDAPESEQTKTVFSVAFNLTEKVAWVINGNPCQGEYRKYEL